MGTNDITPIQIHVLKSSHEKRIVALEEGSGRLLREFVKTQRKVTELKNDLEMMKLKETPYREPEDSQTSISVHPNKLSMIFKNSNPYINAVVVFIIAVSAVAIAWIFKTK